MEHTVRLDTRSHGAGARRPRPITSVAVAQAVAVATRRIRWERVMVGVDDPLASAPMLEEAIALAREAGAKLCMVHVVMGRPARLEARGLAPATIEDVCRATGRAMLLEAQGIARRGGVEAETVLVQDDDHTVGEVLAEEARRWQADVIVLGTGAAHGRHVVPVSRRRIAETVLGTASVPVLLVPGPNASCTSSD